MSDRGWTPTDHACRFCGGRIMRRKHHFRCHHCGAETDSGVVKDICGCGLSAGPGRYPFHCVPNPAPSPANPAIIVIERRPVTAKEPVA